jgi:hypothetical protein
LKNRCLCLVVHLMVLRLVLTLFFDFFFDFFVVLCRLFFQIELQL